MVEELPKHNSASDAVTVVRQEDLRSPEILDVAPEDAPHLLDYWQVIVKRRWAVISCFLIVFFTVAIGTLKEKPVFEGKALVEIDPEPPSVVNFKELFQVDTEDADSYRETQYKVLQSRSLAEKVVRDLKLYLYPEFYQSRSLFGLIVRNPKKIPSPSDLGPPGSDSNAFRNSVTNFMSMTGVDPVRQSNLVEVSFDSHDPQMASRIANQLAADYIKQNLQVKWDETIQASHFLQTQLVALRAKYENSEDALAEYAAKNSIVFLTANQNMVNARLEQLQEEFTKAEVDKYQKESLYNLVQAGKTQDLPGVLSNQLIQKLTETLADLKLKYADLTTKVKPSYPSAVALKRQIDTIQKTLNNDKETLAKNISQEYHAASANEDYLAKAIKAQKKAVDEIAQKTIHYNILARDVDSNKQLYDGLLQRLKEAQVSAGDTTSNIRIVDTAELPKHPVKPRVPLNLALGMVMGMGLGVSLAFFQEYLDKTLKTPDEVEQLVRLPSLGVLPTFALEGARNGSKDSLAHLSPGAAKPALTAIQTNPAAVEAFRSLRTSILLSASPVPKMLLITSALPSEGKTSVTVNLGSTLASLGSRVVIVDCDMRRPACHRATGVPNRPGFVQCLTGRVELQEALLPVPGVNNLHVIPCGPIPPNPAELLSSPFASELLHRLRSDFDYVLVDSPPALSVADSLILATITDAAVIVARANSTPYDAVARARTLLYSSGARILGVALNDLDLRRGGYGYNSYYQYRYGYSYGYGYGNGAEDGSRHEMDAADDDANANT